MRRILCMSHGPLAKGMIETLKIIVGELNNVDVLCAYIDGNNDVEQMIDAYLKDHVDDELIVVTDIFGGSINNEWLKRLSKLPKVFLISGMHLSLLVELYLKCQSVPFSKLLETLDNIIGEASGSIQLCNRLSYELIPDEF
ncbi:PTS fructose IIA subunit [Enterococcus asini]|uniref:PTS sugar transporter subunit IIA n=1 Tax=Enterococcus asini TaxID=57732 RepID=UPI002891E072|nr:PTS fructose IIA subunit [Enterococcus asini]MDT2757160.1 PTS fructose IIA subunit [Enterococcus asini]